MFLVCHSFSRAPLLQGIGGTPYIDVAAGLVYAVSNGSAHARRLADGGSAPGWPVSLGFDPNLNHNYGGLALVNGILYITLASHCDVAPYFGQIIPVNVTSSPPTMLNTSSISTFYPVPLANQSQYYAAGIWGSGGVVIAPVSQLGGTTSLFTSVGNTGKNPNTSTAYSSVDSNLALQALFYGESVVRLSANLSVQAFFTSPAVYLNDDNDFGATPAVFTPAASSGRVFGFLIFSVSPPPLTLSSPRCGVTLSVAEQKAGLLVVNDAATQSNFAELQVSSTDGDGFQTTPTYDPVRNLLYVSNQQDGAFDVGLLAFAVTPACGLSLAWRCDASAGQSTEYPWTSPTLANGVVYVGTGNARTISAVRTRAFFARVAQLMPPSFVLPSSSSSSSQLHLTRRNSRQCHADTGALLWSAAVATGDALSSPVVVNGVVYTADFTYGPHGTLYAWALPASSSPSPSFTTLKELALTNLTAGLPSPDRPTGSGGGVAAPPSRRVSAAAAGVVAAACAGVCACAAAAAGVRARWHLRRRIPPFPTKTALFRGAAADGASRRFPALAIATPWELATAVMAEDVER